MNNTFNETLYKCGVCGKAYESIAERAECELACVKRKTQEEAEAAAKMKAAEKDARFAEVTCAIDSAYELLNKCIKDYGEYVYTGNLSELDMDVLKKFKVNGYSYEDFLPTKLLHYFLF